MGYCDELYQQGNIIGYTGYPYDSPTLYFCDASDDDLMLAAEPTIKIPSDAKSVVFKFGCKKKKRKILFGHIMQIHDIKENIGRQRVVSVLNYYCIINYYEEFEDDTKKQCKGVFSHEYCYDSGCQDDLIHTSRSEFISIKNSPVQKISLVNSISRFQNMKKYKPTNHR
jgi:hypothetical protein